MFVTNLHQKHPIFCADPFVCSSNTHSSLNKITDFTDFSLRPPQRSSLPGLRCWQPQCRPAPARSGLLTQTWNCLALTSYDRLLLRYTHTHCYLTAPFYLRCETAAKCHPERKSAAPYPELEFVNAVTACGSVKFFASGVNFSIFTHFFVFLSLKVLKLGEIDGVKFLAWKSDGVKFMTNSMSGYI